jgi:hypothetical protein
MDSDSARRGTMDARQLSDSQAAGVAIPGPRALGGAQLITRDTNLRINSFNSASGVALTIVARSIGFDGAPIVDSFAHAPNTDRSIKSEMFLLSEGWLVSLQVYASSGTPRRGQCFVRADLIQGFTGAVFSLATILQGYVQDTTALAYPGSDIIGSTRDRGVIRSITGTNPAAGVEISETVPTNARWNLLAFHFTLVVDATVASRSTSIVFDDGAANYTRVDANVLQTASQTNVFTAAQSLGFSTSIGASRHIPIPAGLHLVGGHRIRTLTGNLQAADDYGAPQYLVEEWIED